MAVKEYELNAGGIRMDCIEFGRGKKPLVMLQGLNTNGIRGAGLSLAWMYRRFGKTHRVYLFDRRKELPDEVTVRELAQDVALAMDELGIKNADVIGVSMGGMMAQYLAAERPELVGKLVLAVTTCKSNAVVEEAIARWMALTEQKNWRELTEDMALRMYSEAYLQKYKPFLPLLALVQAPREVQRFLTLCKACLTCDARAELSKIRCPVLVIGGGKDRVVGDTACTELASALGCESYVYEELGHAAYEEAVDFNARMHEFLMRL